MTLRRAIIELGNGCVPTGKEKLQQTPLVGRVMCNCVLIKQRVRHVCKEPISKSN